LHCLLHARGRGKKGRKKKGPGRANRVCSAYTKKGKKKDEGRGRKRERFADPFFTAATGGGRENKGGERKRGGSTKNSSLLIADIGKEKRRRGKEREGGRK